MAECRPNAPTALHYWMRLTRMGVVYQSRSAFSANNIRHRIPSKLDVSLSLFLEPLATR